MPMEDVGEREAAITPTDDGNGQGVLLSVAHFHSISGNTNELHLARRSVLTLFLGGAAAQRPAPSTDVM